MSEKTLHAGEDILSLSNDGHDGQLWLEVHEGGQYSVQVPVSPEVATWLCATLVELKQVESHARSAVTQYAIRNKDTGLWSSGGSYPSWVHPQQGKIWSRAGSARAHLTQVRGSMSRYSRVNQRLVEYMDQAEIIELHIGIGKVLPQQAKGKK